MNTDNIVNTTSTNTISFNTLSINTYRESNCNTSVEDTSVEDTSVEDTSVEVKVDCELDFMTDNIETALDNKLFDQINYRGVYFPSIFDIKYNDKATIVTFSDRTKVVVKASKNDKFTYEQGLVYAIAKRIFGHYDEETGEYTTEGFSRILNNLVKSGYDLNQNKLVDEILNPEKYKKLEKQLEKEKEQQEKIRENQTIKKIKRKAKRDAKRDAIYNEFYEKYSKEYDNSIKNVVHKKKLIVE